MNTTTDNPQCPDFTSHEQNVAEAMGYQPGSTIAGDDFDEWRERAEAEYQACEGHA